MFFEGLEVYLENFNFFCSNEKYFLNKSNNVIFFFVGQIDLYEIFVLCWEYIGKKQEAKHCPLNILESSKCYNRIKLYLLVDYQFNCPFLSLHSRTSLFPFSILIALALEPGFSFSPRVWFFKSSILCAI